MQMTGKEHMMSPMKMQPGYKKGGQVTYASKNAGKMADHGSKRKALAKALRGK